MAVQWSDVAEDAELMREALDESDHFRKEDSGTATNDAAGTSEFIVTSTTGGRYRVTVHDIGD
jgi:hypothetical protein